MLNFKIMFFPSNDLSNRKSLSNKASTKSPPNCTEVEISILQVMILRLFDRSSALAMVKSMIKGWNKTCIFKLQLNWEPGAPLPAWCYLLI